MTDRKQILFGITDADDKTFLTRMCDKADKAVLSGINMYTRFMAPRELNMIIQRFGKFADVEAFGGYDNAERALVRFYDSSFCYEDVNWPISVLKITSSGGMVFGHRDYMGSLLGLGIKREMLGDIVICSDCAVVFCHSDIEDFILLNFTKVGRTTIRCELCNTDELELPQRAFKDKSITVSSLRLDCVVSAATNLSRSSATEAVRRGAVTHNYEEAQSASKIVTNGDVISVRGFGKFVVECSGELTKKGRYHATIKQYI